MNPLRLRASNFRSYDAIDLDFPQGAIAIAGPNGAGKSSLIAALDVALFGARNLGDYLSEDADEPSLLVELTFEHAGETFRVRRTYSAKGRGKSTTDLELRYFTAADESWSWTPLTRESQAATQEAIEEILGLSRDSFHASALLMQGDSGAFTEAKPAERKAILADVLGLQRWEQLLELARIDKRSNERQRDELAGRISLLEESSSDTAEIEAARSSLRTTLAESEKELARAGEQLDEAALAARTMEQAEATYRERKAALDAARARAEGKQALVDRAAAAKIEAVEVQRQIDTAGDPSAVLAELAVSRAKLDEMRERRREAESVRDRYLADATDAEREVERIRAERAEVEREIARLDVELGSIDDPVRGAHCPTCNQELRGDSREMVVERLGQARDEAARRIAAYDARITVRSEYAAGRAASAAAVEIPDAVSDEAFASVETQMRLWRERETALALARQRLAGLQATIDELTPEVISEVAAANEALLRAQESLAEIDEPEPGTLSQCQAAALAARGRLAEVQARVTQDQASLARADAQAEQAQKVAAELDAARRRQTEIAAELELLALLERAYGRDGIPALIVESSAIPQIEAEANRILAELGTAYRVELRTQRELKSGDGLVDTLDVVVIGDVGARAYETFSGGERSRLNVALRIALARLLAHRRGAESRLLCLDEVEYLDAAGQMALAGVLIDLARSEFDRVITVSHADTLREMFDTTIEVVKEDGRSRIVGAREAVAA